MVSFESRIETVYPWKSWCFISSLKKKKKALFRYDWYTKIIHPLTKELILWH